MSVSDCRQSLAEAYLALHESITHSGWSAEEEDAPSPKERPNELELQCLWMAGLLGHEGQTERHGHVRILDFGIWNRSAGPDFRRCEIELNGQRLRGDIELDPSAPDWERHGHGANPNFDNVVLHVVTEPCPAGWYTRNSQHKEIPVLAIPPTMLRLALGKNAPVMPETTSLCREPLAEMPYAQVHALLKAGAAFRMMRKRRNFRLRCEFTGTRQAWYECWAETLGYHLNKTPMQMLARRAPLAELDGKAESILFGTAGFLVPVLPDHVNDDTRTYHRHVWDKWWPVRDDFELSGERTLPWILSPIRPVNHPHRRVAALALAAQRWQEIEPLLHVEGSTQLAKLLSSLRHPYWDWHCTLPSAPLARRTALVGTERVQDFIINHVYVQDETPGAWEAFQRLKVRQIPTSVTRTARRLFGDREDVLSQLNTAYVQQALLQIDCDFCACNACGDCLFPEQLAQWHFQG